jgi:hypothetical protein
MFLDKRRCYVCKWFETLIGTEKKGKCIKHSPYGGSNFPIRDSSDLCGEFESRDIDVVRLIKDALDDSE